MSAIIDQARAFAIAAHGEQRYGNHPYVVHLDAVAAIAAPFGDDAVVVAYLHDTVEDTGVTLADIDSRFGPFISSCVSLLTDEPGPSRKERKVRTYARLAQVAGRTELALQVKVADRLANVRACIQDRKDRLFQTYRSEQEAFRRAAYRPGLCEALWDELDRLLTGQVSAPTG